MLRSFRSLVAIAFAILVLSNSFLSAAETKAEREARMKWWHEAKFGMFIHWGVYSVPAGNYHGHAIGGIGEWIMCNGHIPMATYQEYAKEFNPVKFNADEWVSIAKDAGMKYMVITAKHHDGFAMFDTKASDWSIMKAAPFGRDPLQELAAACRKHGMKLGFYYSQAQDWNNGGSACSGKWDPAQKHDMDDYIDKVAVPQVKELLSNYGEFPAVLWWDTSCDMNEKRAAKLDALLKLKPGIITNNRLGGGFSGDTETPEQTIPASGFKDRDWETCMTLNDTWGYKRDDHNWKSTETLLRNLIDIASKGGNYLLNVGPTNEGLIPQASVERLREVGAWMKVNGESIYGATAGPFKHGVLWGRATQNHGTLYLHVFNWPTDGQLLVPLANKPVKARLLAGGQALEAASGESGITIKLPAEAPDKIASVIALELDGPPQAIASLLHLGADGAMTLKADTGDINGAARLEDHNGVPNIGYWTDASTVTWNVDLPAGEYNVQICSSGDPSSDGNEFRVEAGDQALAGAVHATGDWTTYETISLGKLTVPAGTKTIVVKPTKTHGPVMNLRWIKLTKAG